MVDTIDEHAAERVFRPGVRYPLQGRSVAVFRLVPPLRERRRIAARAQGQAETETAAAPKPEPVAVGAES